MKVTNDTIKVKIQPKEWFEKNCYKDPDGDWWRFKELADIYNRYEISGDGKEVYFYVNDKHSDQSSSMGKVVNAGIVDFRHWSWAVDYYVTPEEYPEEYL